MKRFLILALFCSFGFTALAQSIAPRDGWVIQSTPKPFDQLLTDLKKAVKANSMGVVTHAGPTGAAKARGITIPKNRIVGVFNNTYAVRILNLSVPAMIEAPIRFYLTEEADGTATLSYKEPSFVFAPYTSQAPEDLTTAASELDDIFQSIAETAAR